jgi:hypothetical protein
MTPEQYASVSIGSVVQIAPTENHKSNGFDACLLIVTERKSWGVQGFVPIPKRGGQVQAFYRVPFDDIELIGHAQWTEDSNTGSAA